MSTCWLIETQTSEQELEKIRRLGMIPVETISWHHSGRSISGLINLLKQAGAMVDAKEEPTIVVNMSSEINKSGGQEFSDIGDYFQELTRQNLDKLGIQSTSDFNGPNIIAFNLMPFYPRAAVADRVIDGICRAIKEIQKLPNTWLAFFVRTHRSYSSNDNLRQLIQSQHYTNRAIIIDLDGFSITIEHNPSRRSRRPRITRSQIARSIFERVLHFKDKHSFRRALVYQTNINIGHFDVGSCHVRTHYDLTDFVRRDNVFEHLYNEFCRIINNFNYITVIAAGFERKALTILGNRLQSANANDPLSIYSASSQKRTVTWLGHFSPGEINQNIDQLRSSLGNSDCVLLLTDIVNSGLTVSRTQEALRLLIKDIEGKSKTINKSIEIKTFAMAKMKNSPPDIDSSIIINRPYFSANQECPLCILGQPLKKVNHDTWEEDFRYVDPAQLTPLDFWEMVRDCGALRQKETYLGGVRLTHRVDTKKIIDRYSHWLSNVIKSKYSNLWSNPPDVIITVSEEPGYNFANLVGKSLRPQGCRIIDIPRLVLDESQKPSDNLVNELRKYKQQDRLALLVDDGINLGGTARKLYRFVHKYGVTTLGMLVLDNRLSMIELEKIGVKTADRILVTIYTWPSPPVEVL